MSIEATSPLYEYWISDQDDIQEEKRLLKVNSNERASILLKNEPYKWENLYQSILRRIISGDKSSLKGLMVLLSTLNHDEKNKCLSALGKFLDISLINKMKNEEYDCEVVEKSEKGR